jgi:hypothetical protein
LKPTPPPGQTVRKRSIGRTLTRLGIWLLGIPLALVAVLYAALLIHPIPLPFLSTQIRNVVVASMPAGTELELGDMALALEGYAWPVIQFSPVTYKDTASGARVGMDALEVGFSPIRALIGQPGATVTVVGPHLQVNQDLFGPRLAQFEVVPSPDGGPVTVRVLEGSTAFPNAGIHPEGIDVTGGDAAISHMRSDNDWLVYNLEAAQRGIASIIEQAQMGRFSKLIVKNASLDMNDALYGVFRTFTDIQLDIAPTADGKAVEGTFAADFGGTVMKGNISRVIDSQGVARLKVSLTNFDLASFVPNINDTDSLLGIAGGSAVSLDVGFDAETGKIRDGDFRIDMTGTDLRLGDNYFPIASNIIEVHWAPASGTFTMDEATLSVGAVTAKTSGVFVLGLDELYGPTVAVSMTSRDVQVRVDDLPPSDKPLDVSFKGWSAPLYGAVGIDQAVLSSAGMRMESRGRVDILRKGVGIDMAVTGGGMTADDLKRMWPTFMAPEARSWFIRNLTAGTIDSANIKVAFPVGTLAMGDPGKPIPQNGVFMEMVASGVTVRPLDDMAPIAIEGKTRLQMHDSQFTLAGDGGVIPTDKGNISVANAAVVWSQEAAGESLVEISGDVSGGIPALTAIANQVQPDALKGGDLPVDLDALVGDLNVRMVATSTLDANFAIKKTDYSINGNVVDFGSSAPLQNHTIGNGQLAFMATQDGYHIAGSAQVDGMDANLDIAGDLKPGSQPQMTLSSTVKLADLAKMGFDASQFGTGEVAFTAKPAPDGSIAMSLDLKQAALTIKDIGITKQAGEPGSLQATIRQKGDSTDVSDIDLAFGSVKLKGSLEYDAKKGLQSAEFSSFALSPGDAAQLSLTPIKDGFQLRIRGDQLDLTPMLKRFFSLDQGSGGPQATSLTQTIAVDAELKRALGFYKTTAYNLTLDLAVKGTDVRKANLKAQIGTDGVVSVATNLTPDGRTMSLVFNDLGSLLRLAGVYPQIEGGEGSLVLQQNTTTKVDNGVFTLKNFAIVDEKNVADILESHPDSRRLIARRNKLEFRSGKVDFTRRSDRIQINQGVLTGDSVGGTAEGFIYTSTKQYDIVGTYIPMFGINNAFGKLFGPLGGGANGGLFGITFAIKGPLDNPQFKVNPMSALVPGAFRSLFEFRAKEQPRVDEGE